MNELIKEQIIKFLKESNYNLYTQKAETIQETTDAGVNMDNMGVTSDGIQYNKKVLIDFLLDNGYPLEQTYIDYYAIQFSISSDGKQITRSHTEYSQVDALDDLSDSDMSTYMNFIMMKQMQKLIKMQYAKRIYTTHKIEDKLGALDSFELLNVLRKYADDGWTFKFAITNEIGKNAIGIGGIGVNSTQEETVLVFEKLAE